MWALVGNQLKTAVQADYVVLGGNARLLKELPPDTRDEIMQTAFEGGYRLWKKRFSRSTCERFAPRLMNAIPL